MSENLSEIFARRFQQRMVSQEAYERGIVWMLAKGLSTDEVASTYAKDRDVPIDDAKKRVEELRNVLGSFQVHPGPIV